MVERHPYPSLHLTLATSAHRYIVLTQLLTLRPRHRSIEIRRMHPLFLLFLLGAITYFIVQRVVWSDSDSHLAAVVGCHDSGIDLE